MSLRDGSKSRFVSAAGDETRQGEAVSEGLLIHSALLHKGLDTLGCKA